jgi:23S rRNA (cytosine1962-C5)-methyltransferase
VIVTGQVSSEQRRHDPVKCLERALTHRRTLLGDPYTNTCRVFNAAADGISGLVIEKFADVLVAQLHEGRLRLSESQTRSLCAHAQKCLEARAVYRKIFARERSKALPKLSKLHSDPTPWLGEPVEAEIPVVERGVRYLIRPYDGYSVGLFLEHRNNRRRLRELAAGLFGSDRPRRRRRDHQRRCLQEMSRMGEAQLRCQRP